MYLMGRCALGLIVSGFGGLPHCEMRKSGGTGDSLVCDAADAEAYCFSRCGSIQKIYEIKVDEANGMPGSQREENDDEY